MNDDKIMKSNLTTCVNEELKLNKLYKFDLGDMSIANVTSR